MATSKEKAEQIQKGAVGLKRYSWMFKWMKGKPKRMCPPGYAWDGVKCRKIQPK